MESKIILSSNTADSPQYSTEPISFSLKQYKDQIKDIGLVVGKGKCQVPYIFHVMLDYLHGDHLNL